MVSTVDDIEEILFSFPLVVKDAAGSVSAMGNSTFIKIRFPFVTTIDKHDASDAIASLRCFHGGHHPGCEMPLPSAILMRQCVGEAGSVCSTTRLPAGHQPPLMQFSMAS